MDDNIKSFARFISEDVIAVVIYYHEVNCGKPFLSNQTHFSGQYGY